MTSIYDWSLDAAANANADTAINWAEGQPPGSINNSARAMMQRVAEYLRDQGGSLVALGSANAITLTLNVPVAAYQEGIMMRFQSQFANSGAVTLAVNTLGAKPVFMMNFAGVHALVGGEIQAGGIYNTLYMPSLEGGGGGWLLLNPTQPQPVPSGLIAAFASPSPPDGWLECAGQEISRTVYANLFTAIGTNWGAGDGVTSFRVPDLRGLFLRGWDHGRGFDSGRTFASTQDSQNKLHDHGGFTTIDGNHSHAYTSPSFSPAYVGGGSIVSVTGQVDEVRTSAPNGAHQHQIAGDGGDESRPRNSAVLYAIKL